MPGRETRCGYVAIVGKPNAGKSTLMNALLKMNLSIVNRKVQTTRNKIIGILSEKNYQIILIDTPGILKPMYELQSFMLSELISSFNEADVILYLIDAADFSGEELKNTQKKFAKLFEGKKVILVLNKVDAIDQIKLKSAIQIIKENFNFGELIGVSALRDFNLLELKMEIVRSLPVSPFLYDPETITDKPEKFFTAEIIRNAILRLYREEIPYSVFVEVREFKERPESKDYINADIIIERESQKMIILGKGGDMIKKLGQEARKELEAFLGRPVYLKLFVKIQKDWRRDNQFLKNNF